MNITAQYTASGSINVTIDGKQMTVPDDMSNRDRRKLAEWEAQGNTIAPYVPPAPPTAAELDALDTAALNTILLEPGSIDRAELRTLFNHENRIRALEGKAAITQNQFVTAAKATMRNGA